MRRALRLGTNSLNIGNLDGSESWLLIDSLNTSLTKPGRSPLSGLFLGQAIQNSLKMTPANILGVAYGRSKQRTRTFEKKEDNVESWNMARLKPKARAAITLVLTITSGPRRVTSPAIIGASILMRSEDFGTGMSDSETVSDIVLFFSA